MTKIVWIRSLLLQSPQTVPDLSRDFFNPHSLFHRKLARQSCPRRSSLPQIETYSAVLAIFIPAESTVGNSFRGEKLEATQECVVLRDLVVTTHDGDFDQAGVRPKKRGRSRHAPILGARRAEARNQGHRATAAEGTLRYTCRDSRRLSGEAKLRTNNTFVAKTLRHLLCGFVMSVLAPGVAVMYSVTMPMLNAALMPLARSCRRSRRDRRRRLCR
jgi:hypothetical protein